MSTLEQLSKITGFKRPEMEAIWKEVQDNKKALNGCDAPHDFSICLDRRTKQPIENPTPMQRFGCKWRCSKCGGIVDTLHKSAYESGLNHSTKI